MRRVTSLVLVVLVVTAGCSGGGLSQQTGEESAAGGGGAAPLGGDATSESDTTNDAADRVTRRRELIRTAEVTVEVDDFAAANERLTDYARSTGGFVGDSSRQINGEGNDTWVVGRVTLRIPADNYSEAVAFVRDTGRVRASRQSTRDVTDQIVDLQARLGNLRSQREQLRTLYERANTTEDVLAVQRELSRV
ncbi:MAG: hypothetical protein J07HB67_02519, partial [halophilic archaeon J07HB67]